MVKISVVVPVYNAESIVERCVDSIISNNYDNLEVILVEDCSKDNSLEKCKELSKKYDCVRYVHNGVNMVFHIPETVVYMRLLVIILCLLTVMIGLIKIILISLLMY